MDILGEDTKFKKEYFDRTKNYLKLPEDFDMSKESLKKLPDFKLEISTIIFCLFQDRESVRPGLEKYFSGTELKENSYPPKEKIIDVMKKNYGSRGTKRQYELIGKLYWDSIKELEKLDDTSKYSFYR